MKIDQDKDGSRIGVRDDKAKAVVEIMKSEIEYMSNGFLLVTIYMKFFVIPAFEL